jgi:hypothetical protein
MYEQPSSTHDADPVLDVEQIGRSELLIRRGRIAHGSPGNYSKSRLSVARAWLCDHTKETEHDGVV